MAPAGALASPPQRRLGLFARLKRWLVGYPPRPLEHLGTVQVASIDDDVVWQHYVEHPDADRIGICSSGGGLRSASYNLGALQVLREQRVLGRAAYQTAVSGGCYIASAMAVTTRFSASSEDPGDLEELFVPASPAWSPGSPEEIHLRSNTDYLAPGVKGKLGFAVWLLFGLLGQVVPFLAASAVVGLVTVRLYAWKFPSDGTGAESVRAWGLGVIAALLLGALFLVWLRVLAERANEPQGWWYVFLPTWARRLVIAAALTFGFVFVIPVTLEILRPEAGELPGGVPLSWLGWLSLASVIAAVIVAYAARRTVSRVLSVVAAVVAPLVVIVPTLVVVWWAQKGTTVEAQAIVLTASAAYLAAVAAVGESALPTMHLYYKERLAKAFVSTRSRGAGSSGAVLKWTEPPWVTSLLMSKLGSIGPNLPEHIRLPRLVICAAVNLADNSVPPGRLADTFTFEHDRCGGPRTGYVATKALESRVATGTLTLPALVAISGAAVSPVMGRGTLPAYRFVMALFNVRLGVWLPNPLHLPDTQTADGQRLPEGDGQGWPELPRRVGLAYRAKEAFGLTSLHDRFVYVSDGGHWDNLGLVELLRRGCGQVLCFDASGDRPGRYNTLGHAIALARSELGVTIEIDLAPLLPDEDGVSASDHAVGQIRYPDGTEGVLLYAKTAITSDTPSDARAYAQRDRRFPRHSTSDQFFDDQQFESYRALGRHAAENILSTWDETDPDRVTM